jgi:hypothetical protein
MKCSNYFSKIVIAQSIPSAEMHTGTMLHEDIKTLNAWHNRGLNTELVNIHSKNELLDLISRLEDEARLSAEWPVLHIEAHGNRNGLGLSSGNFITWQELKVPLINLNIQTRNNLLVVLSACYGAYLTKVVVPTDRSPCWGLVGPSEEISASVLLASFTEFYNELFATGNGTAALRSLNNAVSMDMLTYSFTQCELFFKIVYNRYLKDNFTPKSLKLRAGELYQRAKGLGAAPSGGPGEVKRKLLRDRERYFERHQKNFFMWDLYPENRNRFKVTYRDVLEFSL